MKSGEKQPAAAVDEADFADRSLRSYEINVECLSFIDYVTQIAKLGTKLREMSGVSKSGFHIARYEVEKGIDLNVRRIDESPIEASVRNTKKRRAYGTPVTKDVGETLLAHTIDADVRNYPGRGGLLLVTTFTSREQMYGDYMYHETFDPIGLYEIQADPSPPELIELAEEPNEPYV